MRISTFMPAFVVAAFAFGSFNATAAPFEIEENFDEDSHFTESEILPDGWARSENTHFTRYSGADVGQTPKSGTYLLGSGGPMGGEVLYTPMMKVVGGVPFRVEFEAMLPGGNPPFARNLGFRVYAGATRDIEQMQLVGTQEPGQVADWKTFAYSFTPEAEGEYCYAIEIFCNPNMWGGGIYFDDFFFIGTAPDEQPPVQDLEPDAENLSACIELPYHENFSDPSHYDGSSNLPIGWLSVGTNIWRTANYTSLEAQEGEYYMVAPESVDQPRDERAYTPFFNLTAGVEYTISFYTNFDGYIIDGNPRGMTLDFTVGTQQDADFHPKSLYTESRGLDPAGSWTREEVRFTPEKSGPYCFSFALTGEARTGLVSVDAFHITSPYDIPRPEPNMCVKGMFSFVDSSLLSFENTPVRIYNQSKYADSYKWEISDAEYTELPDGNIDIFFPSSGDYEVKLTATNERGSRTTTKTYPVTYMSGDVENLPIMGYDPAAVKYFDRGEIPTFDTDPDELDYVSGYNHYYRKYAERFDLPGDDQFNLRTISLWLTNLHYKPATADNMNDQRSLPFNIVLYGCDENGNLDENKVIHSYKTTMAEMFGSTGIGGWAGEGKHVSYEPPVIIKGTVYVAFEYSDDLAIDVDDPNIGRSYLSMGMLRHGHGVTTMYAKPYNVPEGCEIKPDGKWYPVDKLDKELAGMGLNWQIWVDYVKDDNSVAINNMGEIIFAVRMIDGMLEVSGTEEGEYVVVYDLTGKAVRMVKATGVSTAIDCSDLPAGVYVARANAGVSKFVR